MVPEDRVIRLCLRRTAFGTWLFLLVLLAAPALAQVNCPALVLMVGREQQLLHVQTGLLVQTNLNNYLIGDADWDANTRSLYFLANRIEEDIAETDLYRLAWDATEPERLYDFKLEQRVNRVEVSPDGRTLALGMETRGVEPLDYGVGLALYDIESGELGPVSEVMLKGQIRIAFELQELEWSPAGDLLALTTHEVGPEETTGLLEAACLYEAQPVCPVELLLPDVTRGYLDPTWSADGSVLAFLCLHAEICLLDAEMEQVAEINLPFDTGPDLDWLSCAQYMITYEPFQADFQIPHLLIFDLESQRRLFQLTFEEYDFRELVVIPEGSLPAWVTDEVAVTPEPGR